jgi:hypothetical protein
MTLTILCVEKTGSIKEIELKTYNETELYKKAGFKSAEGFELQTEWGAEVNGKVHTVSVYGKTDGRAGQENKYDFPPPIDNTLFFGGCILINKIDGVPSNLTKATWKVIYEHLFGGFEDYVKDDFVVDDDDYEEDEVEESSEEEIVVKKTKKQVSKKTATKKKTTKTTQQNVFTKITDEADSYLDCTSELSEEDYV